MAGSTLHQFTEAGSPRSRDPVGVEGEREGQKIRVQERDFRLQRESICTREKCQGCQDKP